MEKNQKRILLFTAVLTLLTVSGLAALEPVASHSVDAGIQYFYPIGNYAPYVGGSLGSTAQLNLKASSLPGLRPFVGVDYGYDFSRDARISAIHGLGANLGAGYAFKPAEGLTLTPELGYGVLFHLAIADLQKTGTNSLLPYTDQYLTWRMKIDYRLGTMGKGTVALYLAPAFYMFIEQDAVLGLMPGGQLGARIGL